MISNNKEVGEGGMNCVRNDDWNGYECDDSFITKLLFRNSGSDMRTRLVTPVWITSAHMSNKINGHIEWSWAGGMPNDQRLMWFNALIRRADTYNISYPSDPPRTSHYMLENNGNDADYGIFYL